MSRIGKKIITIPKDVSIDIANQTISVNGKHGKLERDFLNLVDFEMQNNELTVISKDTTKKGKSYHGLARSLVQNMVSGVNEKFSKILVAEGIGFKFQIEKDQLVLNVGFSHPVKFTIPKDLTIKLESPTKISINGIDKEKVGFLAAKIRETKPPEPYKGKGIMYEGEKIIRKAGKTGK